MPSAAVTTTAAVRGAMRSPVTKPPSPLGITVVPSIVTVAFGWFVRPSIRTATGPATFAWYAATPGSNAGVSAMPVPLATSVTERLASVVSVAGSTTSTVYCRTVRPSFAVTETMICSGAVICSESACTNACESVATAWTPPTTTMKNGWVVRPRTSRIVPVVDEAR